MARTLDQLCEKLLDAKTLEKVQQLVRHVGSLMAAAEQNDWFGTMRYKVLGVTLRAG